MTNLHSFTMGIVNNSIHSMRDFTYATNREFTVHIERLQDALANVSMAVDTIHSNRVLFSDSEVRKAELAEYLGNLAIKGLEYQHFKNQRWLSRDRRSEALLSQLAMEAWDSAPEWVSASRKNEFYKYVTGE